MQGRQKVDVTLDYVYPAVYRTPDTFQSSFAAGRRRAILSTNDTRSRDLGRAAVDGVVGDGLQRPPSALAGWNIDVHHTYDPIGHTLYLGDGTKRSADGQNFDVIATAEDRPGRARGHGSHRRTATLLIADSAAHVVRRVDADGDDDRDRRHARRRRLRGDGGPAADAELDHPADVAVGPGRRDLHRRPGQQPDPPDRSAAASRRSPAPATAATRATAAPAADALLDEPTDVAVDAGGAVYVVDRANHAVRRIGPDGMITTLAGNGAPGLRRRRRRGHQGEAALPARRRRHPRRQRLRRRQRQPPRPPDRPRRHDRDDRRRRPTTFGGDGGQATAAQPRHAVGDRAAARRRPADRRRRQRRLRKVASDGHDRHRRRQRHARRRAATAAPPRRRGSTSRRRSRSAPTTRSTCRRGTDRVRAVAPTLPGPATSASSRSPRTTAARCTSSTQTAATCARVDALTKATVLTLRLRHRGRLTAITDGDGRKTTIDPRRERRADGDRRPVRPRRRRSAVTERLPELDRQPGRRPRSASSTTPAAC